MGNCPTDLRRSIRVNSVNMVKDVLSKFPGEEAKVVNEDYAQDCIMAACSKSDGNAMYYAVYHNRQNVARYLITEVGADIHSTGKYGESLLHAASRNNDVQTLRILVERGLDPLCTDDLGRLPLHAAATSVYNSTETIKYLIEVGGEGIVNKKDYTGRIALHDAVDADNIGAVETLIALGSNVNEMTARSNTPLHNAHLSTIWNLLIEAGADPKIVNSESKAPVEPKPHGGNLC